MGLLPPLAMPCSKRYPDTEVLSEPESLYSAYYLYHVNQNVTKEQYHTMVQAAVIMHCLTPHRRVFFKMASGAGTPQMDMMISRALKNSLLPVHASQISCETPRIHY